MIMGTKSSSTQTTISIKKVAYNQLYGLKLDDDQAIYKVILELIEIGKEHAGGKKSLVDLRKLLATRSMAKVDEKLANL